jgi:hypothetical protein
MPYGRPDDRLIRASGDRARIGAIGAQAKAPLPQTNIRSCMICG